MSPHLAQGQDPGAYAREAVSVHAHGAAVAVALRLPAGSGADPQGLDGTAWIAGAVLEDQVNRALAGRDAVFSATVERGSTVFVLLAGPGSWRESWAVADSVVFTAPLDPGLVDRHRTALLERLAFQAGSPVRAFDQEAAFLVAGSGSPFARPQQGTRTSLAAVTLGGLEDFRARAWVRAAAARAVVGPVAVAAASSPGDAAPGASAGGMAWSEGERRVVIQDITNAWIAVAYPIPPTLPRTHAEMLAHLLAEELDPVPPAAERYGVSTGVLDTPRGAVLLVEAAVFPEAAERWEGRILALVERTAADAMGDDFFSWRRRRFRAARLLEEAAPEAEARRLTADLLRDGRVRDLAEEVWALDAEAVRRSAAGLGPPRILVVGPDLRQGG